MLLHGFLCELTEKNKHPSVKLKHFRSICILLYILVTPASADTAYFGEYKAVFIEPCKDLMTLSTAVPNLTQFTVCTYMNLNSSSPWSAFTYKLPSSSDNAYEIGLLGDSSSIKIWMFGTQINILRNLRLNTWYEMCIMWNAQSENMSFYIDGIPTQEQRLGNISMLYGGGTVILGCSNFKEPNSSVGLVGELYMFRMWSTADPAYLQECTDGNIIKWNMGDWIYSSSVVQQDSFLHCAKPPQSDSPVLGTVPVTSLPMQLSSNPITVIDSTNTTLSGTIDTNSSSLTAVQQNVSSVSLGSNTITFADNLSLTTNLTNITTVNESLNSTLTANLSLPTNLTNALDNTTGITVSNTVTPDTTTGYPGCFNYNNSALTELYSEVCSSFYSCNNTVYEVILKSNCTEASKAIEDYNRAYNYSIKYLPEKCKILVNVSVNDICFVWSVQNASLYVQAIHYIEYCCCRDGCLMNPCIKNGNLTCSSGNGSSSGSSSSGGSSGTTTAGIQTASNSNTFSTNAKTTVSASNTTSSNKATTAITIPSSVTNINGANSTVWNTGSISTTNIRSNTTVGAGTTVITNSKTSVSSGTFTSINRTSTTTVISGPTTSVSSWSHTSYKVTDHTNTTSTEFSTSANTTTQSSAADEINNLSNLLARSDLNSSVIDMIVLKIEGFLAGDVDEKVAAALVGVMNSFLNVSQTLLAPVAPRLIKVVDKIGLKLTFPGQSISLTAQSLALAVSKANASSFTGTTFGVMASSELQVSLGSQTSGNSDGSVVVPASVLNDLPAGEKDIASRLQFNYFAKTSLFMDPSLTKNQSLVSKVISSSVANLTVTNLKENITVTLKSDSYNNSAVLRCVFWDFTKNSGRGGWSSEGCTLSNVTQNNETVCKCNHLTSFAILLDMTPSTPISPEDKLILTFITYIGCGLSAIFLSVTLVTYIAFEKIRRDYPSKILIQLCAALIGLNLTFLMNPWIALYNNVPGLCISVAAFLHYFVLVSITWMGLEAFHMYLSLVKVFNTYVRKYILKFCIVGWGAPAVVVAVILAVNKDLYVLNVSDPYPNGSADYFCWMQPIIYWITVVGYFCLIFLLNVSMFVVVLIQLCRIKKQKQLGYQRKTTLQDVRSVAGITFLLGITWGLGFFSFGPGKVAIQYLFTIFNTLQGFFIFCFYCVAKENVRKQWRRYLCCGKLRLAENSDWSKTATNKLRKQTSKQGASSSSNNSIQSTSNSNSTTLLVSNEYSVHLNGNGNVFKERNGVTFKPQNSEVPMQEFPGRPANRNGDAQITSVRRTSNRGSVHFVDQI
ncbi:adhesion G-protein coupled receptor G2 isoform X2 [Hyperolius riggenbachi]|uniref:adhesion G-protein coupled receptor G2 isoform X2 n=1 Tax=Hyperolius riggenbachi TaxID=752182 RepID=UPI0035A367B4